MRFYTARGDDGTTDLLGARVRKDDPRIEAIGSLDETTSAIGFGRSQTETAEVRESLIEVQRDLYRIMAELAFTPDLRPPSYELGQDRVDWIGAATDHFSDRVELPPEFIIPGESAPGAALDVARVVARRAERHLVALSNAGQMVNPAILSYLNRLSSLLFIVARVEDAAAGAAPLRAKSR